MGEPDLLSCNCKYGGQNDGSAGRTEDGYITLATRSEQEASEGLPRIVRPGPKLTGSDMVD